MWCFWTRVTHWPSYWSYSCLMPSIVERYDRVSPLGSSVRTHKALQQLKTQPKTIVYFCRLLLWDSQEGAFQNVMMNYTGDQGQPIHQLAFVMLNGHVLSLSTAWKTSISGRQSREGQSHHSTTVCFTETSRLHKT